MAGICGGGIVLLGGFLLKRRPPALPTVAESRIRRASATFNLTWRPGMKQSPPFPIHDVVSMTPDELKGKYRFFISAMVPRPIAFVSSISAEGAVNLSPFSYSGLVGHDPPTIVFSCVDKNKGGGDTLKNVREMR